MRESIFVCCIEVKGIVAARMCFPSPAGRFKNVGDEFGGNAGAISARRKIAVIPSFVWRAYEARQGPCAYFG
jgi:hypothetical protein